jgi:predicted chitinase
MAKEEIIKQVRLRGKISTDGKFWNEPKPDNLGIGDIKLTLYKSGKKSYFIKFEPVVYDKPPGPSDPPNSTGKNRAYDISAMSYDFEPKPSNDLFKTTDDFVTRFIDDINISIKSPTDWLNPTWDYTTGQFAKYYSGLTQSLPPFYEIVQETFDPAVVPSHPEGYFDVWNKWVEEIKKPKPQPQVIPDPVVIVDSKLKGDFKFNVEKKDTFVIVGATGGSYSVAGELKIITEPVDWVFDNNTNPDDELDGEYVEAETNIESELPTTLITPEYVDMGSLNEVKGFDPESPNETLSTDTSSKYPLSKDKDANARSIIKAAKSSGVTNKYVITAILAIVSKESGFIPRSEASYSSTSAARIKKIFGGFKKYSESEVDVIKKDPVKFFDIIYGGKYGNASNEGYKYRGRGFNQITFKGNYEVYAQETGLNIINDPDLLNTVDVAAKCVIAYFKRNVKKAPDSIKSRYNFTDINSFKTLDDATGAIYHANAGWGKSYSEIVADSTGGRKKAFDKAGPLYNTYKDSLA